MIFSKFFKAKWQHKNKDVRIVAISEVLSVDNNDDRQILMQMVTHDDSSLVRHAALNKLNSFHIWLSTSYDNSDPQVRNFAHKKIISILHNQHEIILRSDEKLQLIKNFGQHKSDKLSTLEEWLFIEQDHQVIKALFEKIAKPQLIQTLFIKNADVNLQTYLVEQVSDSATLEKLLKKSTELEVSQLLNRKLAHLAELIEKPLKLRKSVQLILAKLLALRDQSDYVVMIDKKTQIINDWCRAAKEFSCFSKIEQDIFSDKFIDIEQQLEKLFAEKSEKYQQQKIVEKVLAEKSALIESFDENLKVISQSIMEVFLEHTDADNNEKSKTIEETCQDKISTLENDVTSSALSNEQKTYYFTIIKQQKHKLNRLPNMAKAVVEATRLMSEFSQMSLPASLADLFDKQTNFNAWKLQWHKIEKQAEGLLPPSLLEGYQLINKSWLDVLQPLVKQQKSLLTQTQKKLSEFNRLINSGKYNPSFGVFKKIQHLFEQLNPEQQAKVQRELDKASEKISELNDWEHYIATPRKQQYLKDVEALIAIPLDNPNEQAAKVKEFRLLWNSLGHADEEVDKDLNEAFNQACEDAFAPCRLFYAEQEKVREQNLKTRLNILEQTKILHRSIIDIPSTSQELGDAGAVALDEVPKNTISTEIDWKHIDGKINKLQQKWRDAGEVEWSQYKPLHNDFNKLIHPIKQAIRAFHQQNINEKNNLISKAEQEKNNEDIYSAIETIKKLQIQWRTIGYAGPSQENKLWQTFRSINDEIFAKRSDIQSAEKSQQSELQANFEQKLIDIKSELQPGDLQEKLSLSNFKKAKNELQNLHDDILNTKPVIKVAITAVEQALKQLELQIEQYISSAEEQNWINIFTVLEYIASNKGDLDDMNNIPNYVELPSFWQKKVSELLATKTIASRDKTTLALEIFAGVESPKTLQQERMAVQVSLMQEQMQSGTSIDLQAELVKWLEIGLLQQQDLALLERIKPIYCK
jgi:exonuclease SbcC